MTRRLFLVDINLRSLLREAVAQGAQVIGVFNVVESFIEQPEDNCVMQLLSIYSLVDSDRNVSYAKAFFATNPRSRRLEKRGERTSVTSEEYYKDLLGASAKAIEPKVRVVFSLNGVRYSLESNSERNYSVIQIDYTDEQLTDPRELLEVFRTVTLLGELYMSLEEAFARLHLEQRTAGGLEAAMTIFDNDLPAHEKKDGN